MSELASGFSSVDVHPEVDAMVAGMRATAAWPAVARLRAATRPALEVPPGGAVLDVGCGLADVLIDLGRTSDRVRLVGVDASERMLAEGAADAAAAGVEIDLLPGEATNLPFEDAEFDAVRSERMLQWVDDPVTAVAEMVRVTRPGGAVVLIDTDWRTVALDLGDPAVEATLASVVGGRPGGEAGGRLRRWALDAGLRDVSVEGATAVLDGWSPDDDEGPPGFLPIRVLPQFVHEVAGVPLEEAQRFADVAVDAARRGRFLATVSILAVVGRR